MHYASNARREGPQIRIKLSGQDSFSTPRPAAVSVFTIRTVDTPVAVGVVRFTPEGGSRLRV